MTETAAWENIPDHTPHTADQARERIAHVLDNDPFVRMFSPEIRACMADGITMAITFDRPHEQSVAVSSHETINRYVQQAMQAMPLGFVTDGFKTHMQELVAYALMPKPKYDEWHNAI